VKKIICAGEVEKTADEKWCRRRWLLLKNRENGRYGMVDMFEKRYQKMREKISEWAGVMEKLRVEIPGTRMLMVTLTIKKVGDYSPGMIRDYIKSLKQKLGADLWGFAWVAELQKRGAVHYHLMAVIPKNKRMPTPDKSGMWKWGMSKIEVAKTPYYLCVYIGKERQKDLSRYPKSCRTYAVSYRLPESRIKAYLDNKRDVDRFEKSMGIGKSNYRKSNVWEYVGCTVTKGYAEKVLMPLESQS